jgi:hypothetical protein
MRLRATSRGPQGGLMGGRSGAGGGGRSAEAPPLTSNRSARESGDDITIDGDDDNEDEDEDDLDDDELAGAIASNINAKAGSNSRAPRVINPKNPNSPVLLSRRVTTGTPLEGNSNKSGGPEAVRKRRDTPLRDSDEAVFRFWMMVEDYKRHKDRQIKSYLAEILYTQYLAPSAELSTSPYVVPALRMPAGILEAVEKGLNASMNIFLPRNLFDAAQSEVRA